LGAGRIGFMMLSSMELLTAVPADRLYCWPGVELELVKWNWPLLLLSVFGIAVTLRRREPLWWALGAVLLGSLLVHSIYTAVPRMRVPLQPVLFLYCARGLWAIIEYGERARQERSGPARLPGTDGTARAE
jgi:hypothetical protein